jgi:hypothetical protein
MEEAFSGNGEEFGERRFNFLNFSSRSRLKPRMKIVIYPSEKNI